MFTPDMYRGDYESVGVINVVMHAEGNLVRLRVSRSSALGRSVDCRDAGAIR